MGSTSGNDEPAPGDVLGGRYEILEELGRGGMATVYKGRDLRLSRKVAVKVFRGGFADAMDPRRTAQEMRLLAGVDHPSIVSVLDASNDDGRFGTYLVMELVVGDDLGALLKRARGPLSADFARRIVADVASALELLHSKGVVHRDVKPGNILVSAGAGQHGMSGVTAKLTDFGIAQMVDGAALTAPDSILGTAAYLSPEQVRGTRLRPASDIYSLGLVLLESLTGRRAFPGPAAEAAVARLTRPPALPADASPGLADLLSRMTALDPGDRPRAAEVAEALHEQLAGAITVPDATHTVEVPRADLPSVLERGEDETLPHERSWTPGTGIPLSAPSLDTGPRPQLVPVGERAPGSRSRFPTVLAVGASALAAAVAGILISSSAGLLNAPSGAVAAGDAGAKDGVSASSPAPARSSSSSAPVRVATGGGVVATTPHASPSPTPRRSSSTPSSPTPTATPSSSASGSPDPTTSSSAPATPSAPPSSDPAPSGSTSAPGSTSPTPTDTDSGGPGSGGNGASADSASPSTVSADGAFPDASA
ncbi:serine/threonine-protein kinase [Amnibacterium sp.]|uniref:serine/threonine-protein kinase n=1 Tax=Amnibacterium sp. TaxID=1872496 RepID=UPI0026242390|nr:serine/threonine-protein kinase [Amnibacterium sp.]MCU1474017.1 Serine/threonine-protein kinase StkP [Amnibacterium sp.]